MLDSAGEPVTAGDLLTLEDLARFRRTSSLRGAGMVRHAWATIAGAAALYVLWPSPLTLAVAVVVIGARQLGLAVLTHESAHWLLFSRARLNTWVGVWLCAGPVGADLKAYRRRHHLHHRHTRQPEDPDLSLSAALPVSRRRLAPGAGAADRQRGCRRRARHDRRLVALPAAVGAAVGHLVPARQHHLLVFVPCWKLRAAHRFLLAKKLGPRMERAGSYAEVIGRATT